jgi:putative endonuclease
MTDNRRDPQTSLRRQRYHKGEMAEWIAAALLVLKGHRVLERRYRTPVGEIDLIAKRGSVVAFVEVKRRPDFESGLWSVTRHQQARIIRGAQYWTAAFPRYEKCNFRFDVIVLAPWSFPRHLKDAFRG